LALLWVVLFVALYRDALHLVDLWWNSSTFTHCLLLVPVIGWLVWLRRHELAKLTPRAWWPGLLWMTGGSFVWLVGDAASVAMLRQIGLILLLQGTVPTLLGPQVTRGLIFPLGYAFFLVPFGEELVPPMQMLTADLAMLMLRLVGIPAHIEGIFITTPYGYFAVAEACSGVKFLVAMAALAVLAAHLCFTSWTRRAVFLGFALIVPVLANGVRAFSTILIADYWGTDFAAGADHVIYGWVFFALVMALIGWSAHPWFDRDAEDVPIDGTALAGFLPGRGQSVMLMTVAAVLLILLPLGLDRISEARAGALPRFAVDTSPAGWQVTTAAASDWRARFDGADRMECRRYVPDAGGAPLDLCLAGFTRQGEGRELVAYGQGAVDPDSDWRWGQDLPGIDGGRVARIVAKGRARDTLTIYRIGSELTASPSRVKLLTLKARLTGGDERGYALVLSAEPVAGDGGRERIVRFLAAAGGLDALAARLTAER
jgi:exosortase A